MTVFLDEGVPENLAKHLLGHEVRSARQMGLKGTKNGNLLKVIEDRGFEVFITNDKNMEAEQQLQRRPFAILILSACNLPVILPHIETIKAAVDQAVPGSVVAVACGKFRPSAKSYAVIRADDTP